MKADGKKGSPRALQCVRNVENVRFSSEIPNIIDDVVARCTVVSPGLIQYSPRILKTSDERNLLKVRCATKISGIGCTFRLKFQTSNEWRILEVRWAA